MSDVEWDYHSRTDIKYTKRTVKVPNENGGWDDYEIETHDRPDPFLEKYCEWGFLRSIRITDGVYCYGIVYLSNKSYSDTIRTVRRIVQRYFPKYDKLITLGDSFLLPRMPITKFNIEDNGIDLGVNIPALYKIDNKYYLPAFNMIRFPIPYVTSDYNFRTTGYGMTSLLTIESKSSRHFSTGIDSMGFRFLNRDFDGNGEDKLIDFIDNHDKNTIDPNFNLVINVNIRNNNGLGDYSADDDILRYPASENFATVIHEVGFADIWLRNKTSELSFSDFIDMENTATKDIIRYYNGNGVNTGGKLLYMNLTEYSYLNRIENVFKITRDGVVGIVRSLAGDDIIDFDRSHPIDIYLFKKIAVDNHGVVVRFEDGNYKGIYI